MMDNVGLAKARMDRANFSPTHLQPENKVFRKCATKVALDFGKDSSKIWGLDVLGSVDPHSWMDGSVSPYQSPLCSLVNSLTNKSNLLTRKSQCPRDL